MRLIKAIAAGVASAVLCAGLAAQSGPPRPIFVAFDAARPALTFLRQLLPSELASQDAQSLPSFWPGWVKKHDGEIRARLAQGDEDSLVNLLLFGTSFTKQPRMTARQIEAIISGTVDPAASGARLDAITQARIDDLVRAAAQPRGNERLAFAQKTLEGKGFKLAMPEGQAGAKALLLHALGRVLKEFDVYTRTIEQAERSAVPGIAFARRSVLYRARGLSSDRRGVEQPGMTRTEDHIAQAERHIREGEDRRPQHVETFLAREPGGLAIDHRRCRWPASGRREP